MEAFLQLDGQLVLESSDEDGVVILLLTLAKEAFNPLHQIDRQPQAFEDVWWQRGCAVCAAVTLRVTPPGRYTI